MVWTARKDGHFKPNKIFPEQITKAVESLSVPLLNKQQQLQQE